MADIEHVHTHESIDTTNTDDKASGSASNVVHPFEEEVTEVLPQRSRLRKFAILVALNLSLFVAALDQTITATAIPTISAQLHSASGYTWIGGAYLLANAAASPIWAKLSDIWGRKPMLLVAVAWFFISSIICATAVNMGMLIAGRALQGVAGGALIQLTNITVSDLFSMRERSLYLGLLEFMWALAGGVGPILGGAFTEFVTWRWNFWVNLPIQGTTFVLIFVFLDVHNPRTKAMDGIKAIDWFGSFSILGLVLMLLLGLDFGGVIFPWNSPKVICLIVFGSLMSVFFVLSEKKLARYPLMPLGLFNGRSNIACLLVDFCHGFVFIAGEYYLPLYFQSVMGASPLHSGLYILPLTVLEAIGGILCAVIIHRTGRYQELIWVGLVLTTIGTGLYIKIDANSSLGMILGFEVIAGIGAGLLFEPPMIALQAAVRQDDVATATATFGFVRNLATSMSIVIGGVVIQNSMAMRRPQLMAAGLSPSLLNDFTGGDAAANVEIIKTITDLGQREAVKEAFAYSLRNMWILMTAVAGVGLLVSVFVARTHLSEDHVETTTGIKEKTELQ